MIPSIYKRGWEPLFAALNKLSEQEKGKYFEELTYLVLTTKPVYTSIIKNVWIHGKGMPSAVSKKLNLPRTDEGIDLVAETFSGEYWAIQCKFKGANQSPTYKELSTFTHLAHTHCKNISMALLVHTGERGVRKKHLLGDKYSEIGLEFWLELTEEDWQRIWSRKVKKPVKPQKRLPKPHQKKAISSAHNHFVKKGSNRGRLIMPCGTGKSLTAFWIANKVKAKSVIVAVPSLNLIKQSLEDWTKEFSAIGEQNKVDWKIICSDESVRGVESDEFVTDTASLGVPTTDVNELAKFLKQPSKGKKVVFTTYQSSQRLAAAAKKSKFVFDFAILDEAHKTVGEKSKAFATLLSDKNIKIKKRMFMTATERVLRGKNDDVHSMDDVQVYGDRFYQLTFKEAIHSKPGIISDYKILTIAVTNSQIMEVLQKNPLLTDKRGKISDQEAQSLAAAIALRQATKKYGIKHAISFHRNIKTADKFASLHQELNARRANGINLTTFHISSKNTAGERSKLIGYFKSESLALMTNARCLTEGVNIPAIDCVIFADPKQSVVDIVQAAGRALRISNGKKYGYIMMPIVVPDKISLEEFTETTPFKQVSRIITGLSTQDERIVEELKAKCQKETVLNGAIEFDGKFDFVSGLDMSHLIGKIESKIWERVGRANWRSYDEARVYVSGLGFKNVSAWRMFAKSKGRPSDIPTRPHQNYLNRGWISWGDFLGNKNIATKSVPFLSFVEARKLIHEKKFKTRTQFSQYLLTKESLSEIPSHPEITYKNDGWKGWSDFLGVDIVAKFNKKFHSYEVAKSRLKGMGLSKNEYYRQRKSGLLGKMFPSNPPRTYQNTGWVSWGDYLGTGSYQFSQIEYLSFEDAREFARAQRLTNNRRWSKLIAELKRVDLPKSPDRVYKYSGWAGWPDFLGKSSTPGRGRYLSFEDAKKFAKKYAFTHRNSWKAMVKRLHRNDLPLSAETVYKNHGWKGWSDFLGKSK